jgi:hypothetical protein
MEIDAVVGGLALIAPEGLRAALEELVVHLGRDDADSSDAPEGHP